MAERKQIKQNNIPLKINNFDTTKDIFQNESSKKSTNNFYDSFLDSLQYPEIDRSQPSMPISPMPSPVIPSATPPRVSSAMPPQNVIRNAGIQMMPEEPSDDSSNFLGSLIAQGITGIGTGLMGGDSYDIMRSANVFQSMRDRQANEKRAKLLTDPKSEESKKRRLVFKNLGYDVPEDLSYTDLNDSNVLQGLRSKQMEQPKLAGMTRGGGVGQVKPEKEVKSDKKSLAEYKEHVSALTEMSGVIDNIKKLGRTRIGGITPDFSIDTEAFSSSLDRAAQPMIKTLAGPGTLQKEERDTYSKLVPTGNTRSDLALRQANDIILDGTKISLGKMNTDLSIGNLNRQDYNSLINQYNEQLTKKGIGLNQVINPATGQLELREKKEVELKDGRKVIIDQFGYTWE
jgi:hypothetical protein